MLVDLKRFHCPAPGAEYDEATVYGRIRLGTARLFWRSAMRRYAVEMAKVRRAYRQIEHVYGKLCCGGKNYDIHRLVLVLEDGTSLTIHVGDDEKTAAEKLLAAIGEKFPRIAIGKE